MSEPRPGIVIDQRFRKKRFWKIFLAPWYPREIRWSAKLWFWLFFITIPVNESPLDVGCSPLEKNKTRKKNMWFFQVWQLTPTHTCYIIFYRMKLTTVIVTCLTLERRGISTPKILGSQINASHLVINTARLHDEFAVISIYFSISKR